MDANVKALHYMRVNVPVPGCAMFYQEKLDRSVEVFGYFFLVQTGSHRVLVDTGMGMPAGPEGPRQQVFGHFCVEPGEDTCALLAREGLDPGEIDAVVLTHLHGDHCWNLPLFPRAKIYFSRCGWEAIHSPRHPALYPDFTYPRAVYRYLTEEAWDRVVLTEREDEIMPGIRVFWVGGHSACSQVVVVSTRRGPVILTGDIAFYYANLDENIPVAFNVNLAECYEAMDRIRAMPGMVVPSHDPEILKRHPGGVIA